MSLYKDTNPLDWEDWHWQLKHRIRTKEELAQIIKLTPEEEKGIDKAKGRLAMAITPYWASQINAEDPDCPIRRQSVPVNDEFTVSPHEMADPCAEDRDSPAPHLVHRYPDRVLLLSTEHCAMYCRHCTRRRLVGDHEEKDLNPETKFDAAIEYIKSNRKIRDVLISGGDPLTLEDEALESLVSRIRAISHVELLRIGTRIPVTLPQRVTEKLVQMLKKYSPVWMSIHFNHPKEITKRCQNACDLLAEGGIPLGSQTVLLKGINDRPFIMKRLMHDLLQIRVRPYYIYQCDPVRGTQHFRTPVAVGINIIEKLRGHTSGYAVPVYVIDGPGGGGKIPVGPNYILSQAKGKYVLRNYKGKIYTYLE
ncbi:MAG: KamA family radical SAM protein [Candidatus Omnitrophica bacterium]|nr:KamA family radical SAM protein [Candidatus Omnitrophota bacterium]MBU4303791.1 KamA family radical SAM protein [Candidatus Omnitrophota bacterium]MBU4468599.1 KamA family radical SAM protein [Candidatus Omnitrophota bacterium]